MKVGHKRFYELLKEMEKLHDLKNTNYAENGNPLSNLRECEKFGVPAPLGVLVRMSDKWSRLCELMKGKSDVVGESVKDTLLDLSVYCLLEIVLIEEQEKEAKKLLTKVK